MRRNRLSWRRRLILAGLALPSCLASGTWAGPATEYGLYNTGVDDSQVVLSDNSMDLHYELIEPSHILGSSIVATADGGFPIGPWLDDNHLSAWVTPANDTNGPGDIDGAPSYVYRTTFDLTGVVLGNLSINGKWSTDNAGLDILLNGSSTGFANTAQFGSMTPFTLDNGFINGLNTLDFVINNGANESDAPGPTGLRVEFDGNGGDAPIVPPHPYSIRSFYATGVDDNRLPLEGDVVPDPHYQIVLGPSGDPLEALTVPNDGFPIGPWFANNSRSRWISPPDLLDGHDAMGEPGQYVYETTFNLSGVDPERVKIVAGRGTDDAGPTVLLNGVELTVSQSRGFGQPSWFSLTAETARNAGAELLPGDNTLSFVVENGGEDLNPTGFRLDSVYARFMPSDMVAIPGLYNTGVDDNGDVLADFEPDTHYTLTSAPDGAADMVALGGVAGVWVENTETSRWIGPDNSPGGDGPPGEYLYEIEFDLTGLDPASAVIMGMWSADDVGGEILLNGTPVGNGQRGGFTNLSEFEIAGYLGDTFLPGVNTLGFQITNGGEADNPTGFRVEGLVAFARAGNGLAGDFNGNGTLDAADIDLLSAAVRNGTGGANFDLNTDGNVDDGDRQIWINDLKKTYAGDANLDGEFNSTDFVEVFQAGEYEDGVAGNSTWATGDWNGDAEFDSGDFVAAFQAGGFEQGPRAGVAAVPEPSSMLLFALGLLPLLPARRKRS